MTIPTLPARYLDQRELAELVQSLAARPEVWSDQVSYAGGRRHYASIQRDEYVDVWLICWSPGNDTGWHDHDVSSGAVHVVRGALLESNPRIGGEHVQAVAWLLEPRQAALSTRARSGGSASTPSMVTACCAGSPSAMPTSSARSTRRPRFRSRSSMPHRFPALIAAPRPHQGSCG